MLLFLVFRNMYNLRSFLEKLRPFFGHFSLAANGLGCMIKPRNHSSGCSLSGVEERHKALHVILLKHTSKSRIVLIIHQ